MIKRVIIGIILNGGALYLTAYALEDVSYQGGWMFLVVGAVLIGFLNTFIKPVIKILSLPFIFFSAGLFLIVINALLIFLLKYLLDVLDISGVSFQISGIGNYITAGLVFGLINWVEHLFFNKK